MNITEQETKAIEKVVNGSLLRWNGAYLLIAVLSIIVGLLSSCGKEIEEKPRSSRLVQNERTAEIEIDSALIKSITYDLASGGWTAILFFRVNNIETTECQIFIEDDFAQKIIKGEIKYMNTTWPCGNARTLTESTDNKMLKVPDAEYSFNDSLMNTMSK